jgi:serine/threonine-protein kinase
MTERDITTGINIIDAFVKEHTGDNLTSLELAIITGCLNGFTYQQIEQTQPALRSYSVDYISRNLAYDLWKKLTAIVAQAPEIEKTFKVNKNQLWYLVEQINQAQNIENIEPIIPPHQTMEGRILRGRYEIEEHLFDRDSGERHFRASDRDFGGKSCLVIQRCHQTIKVKQQFEREANILSQLGGHPQIPQLLAYFAEEQYLYLIYEEITGEPLTTKLLTGEPWQEREVKFFLRNILTVLELMQNNNIIHRNLNPDNIIITEHNLVLIDFATVKETKLNSNSISQNTFAQGKIGYMPAEQLMGITSFASDLYAVGKIAIHALTGIHPRKLKIDRQTANPIWRKQAQVNDDFADIIDLAITYHFSQRYQSATQMLESLNNLDKV